MSKSCRVTETVVYHTLNTMSKMASPKSVQWINDNEIDYVQAPYEAEQQLLDEDEKNASTNTELLASSQCIDVEALKDERYESSSIATIDDYSCLVSGNNYMKELVVYNYDDDPLFQQPPPRDDCGVCMLELPINGQVSWCMMSVIKYAHIICTSHMLISYAHKIMT